MITKVLRRLRFIGEDPQVRTNAEKLRERQTRQLSLLEPLQNKVDKALLNKKIQDLVKLRKETVFNTFATRCLNPKIKQLNGLADVNVERVFDKQKQCSVPFTVKDHLKVDGLIHTCGFTDNQTPSTTSADVVHFLEQEGCVAYAKSNVPQGLLGIQSENTLYGLARNPHNPKFISGGSSGGEGTCVASKVSAFGIGSDSGGSARIPAAFCGIYSFKPTGSKRLSLKGRVNPRGRQGVKMGDVDPCMGFMTRNFDDLPWLCSKTLGKSTDPYPFMYGGPWDQSLYEASKRKKLTVGYIYKNHEMKVAPGIINSIEETVELLRKNHHHVVEFEFPKLDKFRDFFFEFIHQSGFLNGMVERMKGHYTTNQATDLYDIVNFGKLGAQRKKKLAKDPLVKKIYDNYMKKRTTQQFFKIHHEADILKKLYLKEWNEKGINVLISPTMPFTALLPGVADLLIYQLSYCCFQNVVELPAGVIPTRLVKPEETKYHPSNDFERKVAPSIEGSQGLPIAIQVTGKHMGDQECLGAMWTINNLVGNCISPKIGENKQL